VKEPLPLFAEPKVQGPGGLELDEVLDFDELLVVVAVVLDIATVLVDPIDVEPTLVLPL
jgi:hypothetical protein